MVRSALFVATLGLLSCAENPPQETQPPLEDVLRLEMRVDSGPKRPATPFEVHFALRNVGAAPIVFCQVDSGVSISVQTPRDSEPLPVVLHGVAINPRGGCHERTTLEPGAAKPYRDTVRLRHGLAGRAYLFAHIRVHPTTPLPRGSGVPHIRAGVPIVIQPPAPAG